MEHQDCGTSGGKSLKIGDFEDDDGNREEKMEIEGKLKSQERVCPICSKKFSSGKAYGGHMSSKHVQQANRDRGQNNDNKSRSSKKLIKRKVDDFIDESDEVGGVGDYASGSFKKPKIGLFSCDYCGKDFPSKKSLFGHMRCHPDRPFRGMEPPESSNLHNGGDMKNSSMVSLAHKPVFEEELEEGELQEGRNQENSILGNDGGVEAGTLARSAAGVVDLAQDLVGRGWFVKKRRPGGGKAIVVNNKIHDYDGDDDEEEEGGSSFEERRMASQLLIHLHNSGGGRVVVAETMNSATQTVAETTNSAASLPSEGMGDFQDIVMTKKTCQNPRETDEEVVEAAGVIDQLKSKSILENDDSDDTQSDEGLVSKKLHYATKGKQEILGKRKNYKEKSPTFLSVVISPPVVAAQPPHSPLSRAPSGEVGKEFTCHRCGKIFPTYQALGGHKSSHNKFRMVIENTIDEVVPCSKGTPSKVCKKAKTKTSVEVIKARRALEFDLNHLPKGDS